MKRRHYTTGTAKNIICKFDNIHTFADFCDTAENSTLFEKTTCSHNEGGSWAGSENWQQAHNYLRNGDAESMNKIKNYYVKLTKAAIATAPRFRAAVAGAVPVVPAYLAGSPKSMLARQQAKTRANVLTIVYNVCADHTQTAADLAGTGAKLLAAVNAIEKSGCRLNIYMAVCAKNGSEKITFAVRVKTDGQRLNLMQIAYPLVNPSFLRRHYFRVLETNKNITDSRWPNNYGVPVYGEEGQKSMAAAGLKFNAYLDYYKTKDLTTEQISDLITRGK